jgi:hypothetical protein
MDIILWVFRRIKVNHAGNAINVNSAGRNIGGNNRLSPALAELLKGTFTLALTAVTVNGNRSHAALFKLLRHTISTALGTAEHHSRARSSNDLRSHFYAICSLHCPKHVLGSIAIRVSAGLFVAYWVVHISLNDHINIAVERCREQQGLARGRASIKQAFHLVQEPHIGHAVCLVEHNKVNLIQVNMALVNQVGQATGTSNSDIYAIAQSAELITKTNTAVERFDCLLGVSELAELLGDLRC